MADNDETVYIRNEHGTIHSVPKAHYEHYLTQRSHDTGKLYPLPGWSVITEAQARKDNPQLFGKPDPRIVFTDEELIRHHQRQKLLRELRGDDIVAPEAPDGK